MKPCFETEICFFLNVNLNLCDFTKFLFGNEEDIPTFAVDLTNSFTIAMFIGPDEERGFFKSVIMVEVDVLLRSFPSMNLSRKKK